MDASAPATASRSGAPANTIQADLAALSRLAWPVVLSRLGIMTMGLTDTIVVGRYSAVQLGYHALGWAPTAVVVTVALGLLTGVQVMTARMIGEGRRALAGAVLRRGVSYGLWIGAGSSLLLAVGGPPFLHATGLAPGLADGATPVLLVFSLSLIPFTLSAVATLWLEALSKPSVPMAMMWLANAVNLAVDLVLVPGRFGAPALGAMGGACATLASRSALTIALFIYIALMHEARDLGVFDKPKRDRPGSAEQRHVGYGAGASNFFEVAAFAGMNLVAGWISTGTLAGYTVVINMVALVFMVPLGFRPRRLCWSGRPMARATQAASSARRGWAGRRRCCSPWPSAVAIWFASHDIAGVWSKDPQVIALAGAALALSCLMLVPDSLQVVLASALRARADVVVPSVTHFISYVVIMAPLGLVAGLAARLGAGRDRLGDDPRQLRFGRAFDRAILVRQPQQRLSASAQDPAFLGLGVDHQVGRRGFRGPEKRAKLAGLVQPGEVLGGRAHLGLVLDLAGSGRGLDQRRIDLGRHHLDAGEVGLVSASKPVSNGQTLNASPRASFSRRTTGMPRIACPPTEPL